MNRNSIEDVLSRPYRRVLTPDPDSGAITGTVPEFPGCVAEGTSVQEAYDNLEKAMASWAESLLSRGLEIPPPAETRDYSGRFPLRLPKSLHERVSQLAETDGVSLNTYLVRLIAEHVGVRQADSRTEEFLRHALRELLGSRQSQLSKATSQ
jgi:antitoxin HicB